MTATFTPLPIERIEAMFEKAEADPAGDLAALLLERIAMMEVCEPLIEHAEKIEETRAAIEKNARQGQCIYCGERFDGGGHLDSIDEVRAAAGTHQRACKEHPQRAVERQRDVLVGACEDLLAAFAPPSKLSDSLIRVETDAIRAAVAAAKGGAK